MNKEELQKIKEIGSEIKELENQSTNKINELKNQINEIHYNSYGKKNNIKLNIFHKIGFSLVPILIIICYPLNCLIESIANIPEGIIKLKYLLTKLWASKTVGDMRKNLYEKYV